MFLGKYLPASKTPGMAHRDDPTVPIFAKKNMILIIWDANASVINYRRPASFNANDIYRHAIAPSDEIDVRQLRQGKGHSQIFKSFLETIFSRQ